MFFECHIVFSFSPTQGDKCEMNAVPFRGAEGSDATGSGVIYADIVQKKLPLAIGGVKWDKTAQSPYFTFNVSNSFQCYILKKTPLSCPLKLTSV